MQNVTENKSNEAEKKSGRSDLILSVGFLLLAGSGWLESWRQHKINGEFLYKEIYELDRAHDKKEYELDQAFNREQDKLDRDLYNEINAKFRADIKELQEQVKKLKAK
ncbi:MAG: hypothetical protein NTX25_00780 [Proteobacteria bacterium]|nr:hypothetical protein [Pseudomonadota bacterium]